MFYVHVSYAEEWTTLRRFNLCFDEIVHHSRLAIQAWPEDVRDTIVLLLPDLLSVELKSLECASFCSV